MNSTSRNDEILFDHLVDDELSSAERRALVESLDARPNGWRQCALAFLEAQSWKTDLKPIATRSQVLDAKNIPESVAPRRASERTYFRTAAQWLAVAAGLLVAFKLGSLQIATNTMPIADNVSSKNEPIASDSAAPPGAPRAANPEDALNLWVQDDAGQLRRVRVPLVDASKLDDEHGLVFQTGVPDDVRNRLQNRGYDVQSKRRYAPMWLDNGRQMIVPVEDTKIVPVRNNVY